MVPAQRNLFLVFCSLPKHLRFASCLNPREGPVACHSLQVGLRQESGQVSVHGEEASPTVAQITQQLEDGGGDGTLTLPHLRLSRESRWAGQGKAGGLLWDSDPNSPPTLPLGRTIVNKCWTHSSSPLTACCFLSLCFSLHTTSLSLPFTHHSCSLTGSLLTWPPAAHCLCFSRPLGGTAEPGQCLLTPAGGPKGFPSRPMSP